MSEAEPVLSLVRDIYDAALDPALWADVLGKARDFVGGSAAALCSKDATEKSLNVTYHDDRLDPRYRQLYVDQCARLAPTIAGEFSADIEQPIATIDLLPYDEVVDTRLSPEWSRPRHLVDLTRAILEKSPTSMSFFDVFREERQGLADDEMRQRMQLIAPHLRRAMLIGAAMERKTAEAASLADALDGFSAGMFLVDASGRIVHANASGRAQLDARSVVRAAGGKLAAIEPKANQELSQTLALANGGDVAVGVKGIAVPLTARDGEHYVAHVLPLTSGERRRAGAGHAVVAALFVRKAELDAPSPPEAIARTYRLTPTELRVLLAVVQLDGVPEVADALGVEKTTVKTHLQRLFAKTDTNRQSDLVKLVAAFANPFVQRPPCRPAADANPVRHAHDANPTIRDHRDWRRELGEPGACGAP
jgi:DNA-binding CsgD family transcriptional regulator/PAS domain-containing protein